MNLSVTSLKTDRQWRSATGLDQKRFAKLLILFQQSYERIYSMSMAQRQAECPEQPALSTYTDLLLFTLFSLKSGLSYDLLGFTTGMDGSTAMLPSVVLPASRSLKNTSKTKVPSWSMPPSTAHNARATWTTRSKCIAVKKSPHRQSDDHGHFWSIHSFSKQMLGR